MRRGEWNLQSDDLLDDPEYGVKRGPLAKVPYANSLAPRTQWIVLGSSAAFFLVLLLVIVTSLARTHGNESNNYKNVIIMISDGFGPASQVMARVTLAVEHSNNYKPDQTITLAALPLDEYLVGTARTYSSNSWVTDSAAGATAYSCGMKTYNNAIGVDVDGVPCGTLFEAARSKGMALGLVVTSSVTHATPASFSSHSTHRDHENFIATQQLTAGLDVMFGGGNDFFNASRRPDGRDLLEEARKAGYTVTNDLMEWRKLTSTPAISLFAETQMSYEIDRNKNVEPSLSEMTSKAIHLLSNKPNNRGFMLLVEGSRIDHAGHTNDPPAHYRDILAYQEAVKVVMDFAKKDGNTIVVSVSDHETGGLTLGTRDKYEWRPDMIIKAKSSAGEVANKISADRGNIKSILKEQYEIDFTDAEIDKINNSSSLLIGVARAFSEKALIGWTTLAHTGIDVNLYAYGKDTEKLRGNHENIEVGRFIETSLGLSLENETKKLKSSKFNPNPSSDGN